MTSAQSLVFFSLVVLLSIYLVACDNDTTGPNPEPVVDTRGDITSLTEIGTFSPTDIQALVDADSDFELPPQFVLTHSVSAYRVIYSTVVKTPGKTGSQVTLASGALLVPVNDVPMSMLTLLHGTESKHDLVASVHPAKSNEGLIGISVAAGGYYIVCLPDYPGYGVSDIAHSYLDIDANVYVGFVFTSFDITHDWQKLGEIFNAPFASLMPSLYDGSRTWGQILASLPATFDELVNSVFVVRYLAGSEPEVKAAFNENTILEWRSVAPVRFFHGDADVIVPITNAHTAIERLGANDSGSVELAIIEGGTHATAGGPAVLGMLE